MKKLFAIILALAMTFALSATALAVPATGTLKITLTSNPASGDNAVAVSNRSFKITKPDGSEETRATNESGVIEIDNADLGTYSIQPVAVEDCSITCTSSNVPPVVVTANATTEVTYVIQKNTAQPPITGAITINDAVPGQTYSIYEMFKVETYTGSGDDVQVVYKVVNAWKPFFKEAGTDPEAEPAGPGYTYIHLDVNGHPTWEAATDDTTMQAFAAAALIWAQADPDGDEGEAEAPRIAPTATKTAAGPGVGTPPRTSVVFDNVEQGYYLVDSTLGALCSITTMHPNATIKDKNEIPGVDKKPDLDQPTLGVGETVSYVAHITNIGGQTDVIFTDTMTGLKYVDGTIKVYEGADATGTPLVAAGHYTFTETDNGFKIEFDNDYTRDLDPTTTITITYDAKITDAALVGGARNNAEVSYNNGHSTTGNAPTTVYNTSFEIHKYHMVEGQNTLLAGATFRLSRTVGETEQTAYWDKGTGDNAHIYTLAGWGEIPANTDYTYDIETNATNNVLLQGLGAGVYTLKETVAPTDYNLLTDNITVTITYTGTNEAPGTFTEQYVIGNETTPHDDPVNVLNQKGGELPGVGGRGVAMFYIIGGLLMVGAAVLLIVRKKMSVME